jgi:ATP synthase protein I
VKLNDKGDLWKAMGVASSIGFTLAATVVAGVFLGRWVDKLLNSSPWATICGILLGMLTGVWSVYKQLTEK